MIVLLVVFAILTLMFGWLWYREGKEKRRVMKIMSNMVERHISELKETRVDAIKRSRSSLEGQIYEQLVPHLPDWKHNPSDARFIGDPIDYIVFDGMADGDLKKITIVEVKKGKSSTSRTQNRIKKLIKEGKVEWELYKIE